MSRQSRNESTADFCRRMGWVAGTWITGTETIGNYSKTDVLEITYVGRECVMCEDRLVERNGVLEQAPAHESGTWTFEYRDWQVYKRAD